MIIMSYNKKMLSYLVKSRLSLPGCKTSFIYESMMARKYNVYTLTAKIVTHFFCVVFVIYGSSTTSKNVGRLLTRDDVNKIFD